MKTIRKKLLILSWICLGLIAGCVLNLFAGNLGIDPLLGVFLGVLVAGSGLIFGLFFLRCPNCGCSLPLHVIDNCCPNCGEPLP